MRMALVTVIATAVAGVTACGGSSSAPPAASAQAGPAPAAAPAADPELEQLKRVTPVEACALLPPEKLAGAFPGLTFEVHQKLDARQSGYAWDSRCTYWAGVGTIEYAKTTPTHTFELFVTTPASEAKARSNMASRHDGAKTATGYQAQPALGPEAYTLANTGVVSLFFVKGPSELQMNFSDLKTPVAGKIEKLLAVARAL